MTGASEQISFVQFDQRMHGIIQSLGDTATFDRIWPAVAQMAVSDVKKNFRGGHAPDGSPWVPLAHARPNSKGSDKPLRDTGILMNSISGKANKDGVTVGTNVEYAPLHQFGGIVRPVKAKFLAIPLTVEAKRAGSPRRFPSAHFRFIPTQTGWIMLSARTQAQRRRQAQRKIDDALRLLEGGKKRRTKAKPVPMVAQFLLVPEVTVPARPFLGFSPKLIMRIQRALTDQAIQVLSGTMPNNQSRWSNWANAG